MPLVINSVTQTDNLQLMKQLAEEGADFNISDYRGRGPIHIAALNGNLQTIKFLVENTQLHLDAMDRDGKTALYYACLKKHIKIAELLI